MKRKTRNILLRVSEILNPSLCFSRSLPLASSHTPSYSSNTPFTVSAATPGIDRGCYPLFSPLSDFTPSSSPLFGSSAPSRCTSALNFAAPFPAIAPTHPPLYYAPLRQYYSIHNNTKNTRQRVFACSFNSRIKPCVHRRSTSLSSHFTFYIRIVTTTLFYIFYILIKIQSECAKRIGIHFNRPFYILYFSVYQIIIGLNKYRDFPDYFILNIMLLILRFFTSKKLLVFSIIFNIL